MFREVTRANQALPEESCIEILQSAKRGVLAVLGDEAYPYAVPIDYWYCEEDGRIYFHSGKEGHKVDALRAHDKASFCVLDEGEQAEKGWWLRFRSVIVFGRLQVVQEHEKKLEISRKLSLKFTQDTGYIEREIDGLLDKTLFLTLIPEHMTGKLVNER